METIHESILTLLAFCLLITSQLCHTNRSPYRTNHPIIPVLRQAPCYLQINDIFFFCTSIYVTFNSYFAFNINYSHLLFILT